MLQLPETQDNGCPESFFIGCKLEIEINQPGPEMVIRQSLVYRVDSLSFAELLKYLYRRKIERSVAGIRYGVGLI